MPLTRYRVRSEYGLADPELYGAADKDDPEALLEGVAMAGLVGVLRQLGDLAEFAAEIFHDLHEEVMATATRGHGLIVRVQQLEAEFPPIEKALLSQTSQSSFYFNTGVEWHPNLRSEQNLIARGDLPRFVMDSYEESRGPPRLFLLDKFDVAGAGACLKRYTDPSFFKVEAAASSGIANAEIPREKKNRRVKKKGLRLRNGEITPEVVPASHTKLQQLFLEERVESGFSDPARLVKLKKRHLNGSVTDSRTGKTYMEKFVDTPKEREIASETSIVPVSYTPEYTSESGIRILEISTVSSAERSPRSESASSSPNVHLDISKPSTNGYDDVDDSEIIKVPYTARDDETSERSSSPHELQVEKQLVLYGEGKPKGMGNGYESDDVTSEVDNYMDALASMESELETDNEYRPNSTVRYLKAENHGTDSEANEEHLEQRTQLSDSQSVGNFSSSDDGNNSFKRNRSSFSYSDSAISLVENTPGDSDNGAKISPSTETCGSEAVNNELSITKEPLAAMPQELVVSPDMFTKEENTTSHGEASSQLHLDSVASSSAASLVGPKIGGTPNEHVVSYSKAPDTVANEANLLESTAVVARDSSLISDLVDELVAEDPNVISDDLLHTATTSGLVSETESRHSSANEDLQIRDEIEASDEISVIEENEPRSVTQKQLGSSTLPDSETSSSDSTSPNNVLAASDRSDVIVPEVDDCVHTEDLPPAENVSQVDSPQTRVLEEPHLPDFTEDVPPVELVSAEASLLFSKEEPSNRDSGTGDFEETGSSTSHEDADGGNIASLEQPSSYLSEPDADAVDRVSDDISLPTETLCSRSENPMDLQEPLIETLVTSREEHGLERDSTDVGLTSSMPNSIIDSTETSASVETRDQEPESVTSYGFNARENGMPLPTSFLPEPPVDQVGAECPVVDEAHPEIPSARSEKSDPIEVDQPSIDSSSLPYQKDDSSESLREVSNANQAPSPFGSTTPNIDLLPEPPRVDIGEMPPLPPLPPMQWRMGFGMGTGTGIGNFGQNRGLFPPIQPLRENEEAEIKLPESQTGSWLPQNQPFPLAIGEDEKSLHFAESAVVNLAHPPTLSMQLPTVVSDANSQHDQVSSEISGERQEHEQSASSSSSPTQTAQSTTTQSHDVSLVENQPPSEPPLEADLDAATQQRSLKSPEEHESPIVTSSKPPPTAVDEQVPLGLLMPEGKTRWLPNHPGTISDSEAGKENGDLVPKIPRPRNPLIDAVNAHGTSKLRKVTERIRPQPGPKADERDSLLEQIRTKSFSLKPATATRPSIGPAFNKTNLKVAAILEKANAIRQSLAGSDDEDDDNWD